MAWDSGVVHASGLRRGTGTIGVENGIFGAKDGEINWPAWGVGYMFVIEFDEGRVEMRQHRRMNRVESFVRHGDDCVLVRLSVFRWIGSARLILYKQIRDAVASSPRQLIRISSHPRICSLSMRRSDDARISH